MAFGFVGDDSGSPRFDYPHRMLDDGGADDFGNSTSIPTFSPTDPPKNKDEDSSSGYPTFLIFLAVILAFFVIYYSFQSWRARRARRLLALESARADRVLGDMQMVPSEDYDDDDLEML